jgi:hypothetical protein
VSKDTSTPHKDSLYNFFILYFLKKNKDGGGW